MGVSASAARFWWRSRLYDDYDASRAFRAHSLGLSLSLASSNLDEDVLERGVDKAPGGDAQRALRLLHGAEDLGDPDPLLGQLELLRPGDVVRPLGVRRDGAADQPLHRLVLARRRRRHREHERAAVLGLQLRHAMLKASAETEKRRRMHVYILPLWRFRCSGDVHARLFRSGRTEPQPPPWNALEVEEEGTHPMISIFRDS
jgi:hypothetical protein